MKPKPLIFIILLLWLISCEKSDNKFSLLEFCNVIPSGWECEIITGDFSLSDIPKASPTPLAIIKYTNPDREFYRYPDRLVNPSLILDLYPIQQKEELIDFIISQQVFSWCIPIYYGETQDYLIITSPCFNNNGAYTDEANLQIVDLHDSLKSIIEIKEYEGLIPFASDANLPLDLVYVLD